MVATGRCGPCVLRRLVIGVCYSPPPQCEQQLAHTQKVGATSPWPHTTSRHPHRTAIHQHPYPRFLVTKRPPGERTRRQVCTDTAGRIAPSTPASGPTGAPPPPGRQACSPPAVARPCRHAPTRQHNTTSTHSHHNPRLPTAHFERVNPTRRQRNAPLDERHRLHSRNPALLVRHNVCVGQLSRVQEIVVHACDTNKPATTTGRAPSNKSARVACSAPTEPRTCTLRQRAPDPNTLQRSSNAPWSTPLRSQGLVNISSAMRLAYWSACRHDATEVPLQEMTRSATSARPSLPKQLCTHPRFQSHCRMRFGSASVAPTSRMQRQSHRRTSAHNHTWPHRYTHAHAHAHAHTHRQTDVENTHAFVM